MDLFQTFFYLSTDAQSIYFVTSISLSCSRFLQLIFTHLYRQFRLHKTAKPEQVVHFFEEWENYLQHIEQTGRERQSIQVGLVDSSPAAVSPMGATTHQSRGSSFGRDVPEDVVLSDEQKGQLGKLREEAAKAGGDGKVI